MLVCHCFAVYDSEVESAIAAGAGTVPEVTAATEAGGGCGGCHPAICARLAPHGPGACSGNDCLASTSTTVPPWRAPRAAARLAGCR